MQTTRSTFIPMFKGHRQTCFSCDQVWGECTCKSVDSDDENAPGFDFKDLWITNPNVSICTRFFVDPTEYYGEAYTSWVAASKAADDASSDEGAMSEREYDDGSGASEGDR